ncbi:15268_t:CDS:1, partial [Acaulospora colombiana]
MTTEEFAGFWTKMKYERKEEVVGEFAIDDIEVVKQRLEGGLNSDVFEDHVNAAELHGKFHIVEIK